MLVWLTLLALGSAFVATPFFDQHQGMAPDYAHAMYLHGLLIGMVGLIAMDVFGAGHKSRTAHNLVLWGTLGAGLFSGIFDHSIGDTFLLWLRILSLFFLDEILITLTFAIAPAGKYRVVGAAKVKETRLLSAGGKVAGEQLKAPWLNGCKLVGVEPANAGYTAAQICALPKGFHLRRGYMLVRGSVKPAVHASSGASG